MKRKLGLAATTHGRKLISGLPGLLCLSVVAAFVPAPGLANHSSQPGSVALVGDLQSELGCSGDWQPECLNTVLDLEDSDQVWQASFVLAAGNWEYKAALNGNWDENYGRHADRNGANIPLNLNAPAAVKFYYDHRSHWITDDHNSIIATAPGSYQSELGCPGDWQPECLQSWLQDADGDGIYSFATTAIPAGNYTVKVAHNESWDENYGAGGARNGADIAFSVPENGDLVVFSYDPVSHLLSIGGDLPVGNIAEAKAYWLTADTLAWDVPADSTVQLHFSASAGLAVTPGGLTGGDAISLTRDGVVDGASARKFRHLAGLPVYRIGAGDLDLVPQILKSQFAVAATDTAGDAVAATGVQPPGVLDDLYAYDGELGVSFAGAVPGIRVWAPTARSVRLHLFDDSNGAASAILPMHWDAVTGTWSIEGDADWNRKYYLFEVEVYARNSGQIVTNLVTDPYSLSLSMDSRRSQIVNLEDADLKPPRWDRLRKSDLEAPEDAAIYELHVRDFSIGDKSVPEALRGTFAAFNLRHSRGIQHLRRLSRSGLSHVHLLPAFDCATIPEARSLQLTTGDLGGFAPDSTEQQAAVETIRSQDGFNWCYDPYHYTAPEGSYATDPDGVTRIREFREMVAGLNRIGLRVVMDVVYNHTSGSLQGEKSVLDKIVPDYYHRLNAAGVIETSSCCANTATEHYMMEKLMLDSLRTWTTAYKVDGFRFDIMGHHTRANIEKARDMLQALTAAEDGVDGASIYLYGEGWNFGEVANDARFVQATQINMGDQTGVGSFNDRLRDGVRGGGPFDSGIDHVRTQGFINGLYTDPNAENSGSWEERQKLLGLTDWIRIGLAGSLRDFAFIDARGNMTRGSELPYLGQGGAGYTSDPQEVINYAAAHDNETLFDISQYKLPVTTSSADRVRVVNLANSIIALSQGVPLFHAGQDMLRSKSLDRNSYDSGDWFNMLDWTYGVNGWGRGLPPERDNANNWPVAAPLLADPDMGVDVRDIRRAARHLREMLQIRSSSGLFRLRTAADVIDQLAFHNTGPDQIPGLIVMSLGGGNGIEIVVLFNANAQGRGFYFPAGDGDAGFKLHPVQEKSHDRVVRRARFDSHSRVFYVPARTTAVFVAKQHTVKSP
ncbi:pullulanase-type alpha-1,6-glucosidase [Pseudomaricurvus alcaniphilus]|uniref:pullulanase-type alpha-1,6-glucosidase n=1 Tax=Pseudomaricurvus alcaniphilus TaxID=1166482 RepID=UPI00140789A9|nr:pullulanase-type alpha-1,6-glucosidase [Pseudomaricurvus alcaniphilus]NHN37350.1 pullulanase-type alpha-1,6-glucosidase [Pseudomaricurvus alcaniphilus]